MTVFISAFGYEVRVPCKKDLGRREDRFAPHWRQAVEHSCHHRQARITGDVIAMSLDEAPVEIVHCVDHSPSR
jgi:hypothetical protein